MNFSIMDYISINRKEREGRANVNTLRGFIRDMIRQRLSDMKTTPTDVSEDFLTLLINDELFNTDEETMINESMTFLAAGTQTTTTMLYHMLYYLNRHPQYLVKAREEIKGNIGNT
jgi:cytochrome P450